MTNGVDAVGSFALTPASAPRRAAAATVDAAALVTVSLIVRRRYLTSDSFIWRLAPVAIQAAYFTISSALAGGSPGQRLAGVRVVDIGTGGRPSWRQSVSRWVVRAGPGILARTVILSFRRSSAPAEARLATLREEQESLEEEFSDDQLDKGLLALRSSKKLAGLWAPPVIAAVVLVGYRLTVGRDAHGRLSGTCVVANR